MTNIKKYSNRNVVAFIAALAIGLWSNLPCQADTFQFELFKKVAKDRTQSNLLLSPYSVETAMTMTTLGASGNTFKGMGEALGLSDSKREIGELALSNLKSLNEPDPDTNLKIVNILFGNKEITFNKTFTNSTKNQLQGGLMSLDFGEKDSINKINNWVKEKSQGKIPSVINKVEQSAKLYLVNAIYFKSSWQDNFDPNLTALKSFYPTEDKEVQVPMMVAERKNFKYFSNFELEGLRLLYKNGRYSMFYFLPNPNSSLSELEGKLNENTWEKWLRSFKDRPGKVTMPKFKISDSIKLKAPLSNMGMSDAFSSLKADFSDMVDKNSKSELFLSEVFHKTFLEVNEQGSEAAAATAVEASSKSIPFNNGPFEMVLDRPFLFAIHDTKTKKILFLGHVADPSVK